MGLMDSLGLGDVEADPNAFPDGWYGTVLYKAGVIETKKGDVSVLLSFKCNDGSKKSGAEKPEFFTLGNQAVKDEAGKITGFTPTIKETQKSYLKKRLLELGVPQNIVDAGTWDNDTLNGLIGSEYNIQVYNKNGFCNIGQVAPKVAGAAPVGSADPFVAPTTAPTTTATTPVSDLI